MTAAQLTALLRSAFASCYMVRDDAARRCLESVREILMRLAEGGISPETAQAAAKEASQPAGYTFAQSVAESGGEVTLDGDLPSPGPNRYYGTAANGGRGWHPLPEGGGGGIAEVETADSVVGDGTAADKIRLAGDVADSALASNKGRYYGITSPSSGDPVRGFLVPPSVASSASDAGTPLLAGITKLVFGSGLSLAVDSATGVATVTASPASDSVVSVQYSTSTHKLTYTTRDNVEHDITTAVPAAVASSS